jgi:cyclic pyranopterin phosphate synthase
VLEGIEAARRAFGHCKIDTVVIRGVNDEDLVELVEFGKGAGAEVRFIEYMDVAGATRWSAASVVSRREILEKLSGHYGPIQAVEEASSAPADRFRLPDGTVFGIIASTTAPFCRRCDRSRLTADGMWFLCLYATEGVDLRALLRRGTGAEEIARAIRDAWATRDDRGAEVRLALGDRRAIVPIKSLRRDPHLEMHTRGG